MYQYFENKKDFYLYLLEYCTKYKLGHINENVDLNQENFFQLIEDIAIVGNQFNLNHPYVSSLLYHAARETENPELGNISRQIRGAAHAYITELIRNAQRRGQIRQNLSAELIGFIINSVSIDVEDYIGRKYNFSYGEVLRSGEPHLPVPEEEMIETIREIYRIIKEGIAL